MKKKSKIILFVLISIHYCLFSQEKNLRFENLTIENGLSQNTVIGIVKDRNGFMWFGTWDGLNRFDGYTFTIYSSPKAFANSRIFTLFTDTTENLWVQTGDSLIYRYNYDTDEFKKIDKKNVPAQLRKHFTKDQYKLYSSVSNKNYTWTSVNNIKIQTNVLTKRKYVYKNNLFDKWSIKDNTNTWNYIDNQEILWTGNYLNGISFADINQKPFYYLISSNNSNSIADDKVRSICSSDSILYVGTYDKGISILNLKTNTFSQIGRAHV